MRIKANGEPRECGENATLADLLREAGLPSERVAVEHNGRIVPRADYAAVRLSEDDAVEIVTLVGGG